MLQDGLYKVFRRSAHTPGTSPDQELLGYFTVMGNSIMTVSDELHLPVGPINWRTEMSIHQLENGYNNYIQFTPQGGAPLTKSDMHEGKLKEPRVGVGVGKGISAVHRRPENANLEKAEDPQWRMPDDEELSNEYDWEYRHIDNYMGDIFPDKQSFIDKASQSRVVPMPDDVIRATDLPTIDHIKDMTSTYQFPRDVDRIHHGLKSGAQLPAPIVVKKDGEHFMMGGNTRQNVARVLGIQPHVLMIDMDKKLDKSNKIPGGLADDKEPEDFDDAALREGVKIELEHTSDPEIALEIAMDHLTEDPKYYKKLAVMESGDLEKGVARKKWPFDPARDEPFENRRAVETWTEGYSNNPRSDRESIKEMHPHAKQRGLHKLSGMTQSRKNPETGEREFLLHRGMGVVENHNIMANLGHTSENSSWTPDWDKAMSFATDAYQSDEEQLGSQYFEEQLGHSDPDLDAFIVHSAWIPESQIRHIPNTIGSSTHNVGGTIGGFLENPAKDPSILKRQHRYNEHEVVVSPHKLNVVDYEPKQPHETSIDARITQRGQHDEMMRRLKAQKDNPPDPSKKKTVKLAMSEKLAKASKKQMKQMVGDGHEEVVNWLSSHIKRDDVQMWFLRNYKKDPSIFNQKNRTDIQHFMSMTSSIKELDELRLDKTHDFDGGMNALKQAEDAGKSRLLDTRYIPASGKKIMDVGNGYAWYNLEKPHCEIEGRAMGHCGNTAEPHEDDTILSLRKEHKVGNSRMHEPKLTFILNNGKLGEMKGKSNDKPDPKYHDAIAKLLTEHPEIKHIIGGGYQPEKNFEFDDMSPELQQKVLASKPDIDPLFSSAAQIAEYPPTERETEGEYGEALVAEEEHPNQDLIDEHNRYARHMMMFDGDIDKAIEGSSNNMHHLRLIAHHRGLEPKHQDAIWRILQDKKSGLLAEGAAGKQAINRVTSALAGNPDTSSRILHEMIKAGDTGSTNEAAAHKNALPESVDLAATKGSYAGWIKTTNKDLIDQLCRDKLPTEHFVGSHGLNVDAVKKQCVNSLAHNPAISSENISDIFKNHPGANFGHFSKHDNFTDDHVHEALSNPDLDSYSFRGIVSSGKVPKGYVDHLFGPEGDTQRAVDYVNHSKGLSSDQMQSYLDKVSAHPEKDRLTRNYSFFHSLLNHDITPDQIHQVVTDIMAPIDSNGLAQTAILANREDIKPETLHHIIDNPDKFDNTRLRSQALSHPNVSQDRILTAMDGPTWHVEDVLRAHKDRLTTQDLKDAIDRGSESSVFLKNILRSNPLNLQLGKLRPKDPPAVDAPTADPEGRLEKGAARKRFPFDPMKVTSYERQNVEGWTSDSNQVDARDAVPEMDQNAKMRGISRVIAPNTQSRKNSKTGEREFLLHRGLSPDEHDHILDHGLTGTHNISSWTPSHGVAKEFADSYADQDGPRILSAWIPESKIHHIPSMIGEYHGPDSMFSEDGPSAEYMNPQEFKGEKEILVKPHKLQVADYDPSGEHKNIHSRINLRSIKKRLNKSDEVPQVASVAVIRGDKVLMGKRRDNGRWTLPGGHLDAGETPEQGAARELYEESGIKSSDLDHMRTETVKCEDGKVRKIHAFVTYGMYETRRDLDPDGEISVWKWVSIKNGHLPKEIAENLHSPKNVTLDAIGVKNLKFD